ncbi:MAG TPA: DUF971 domain-containing protein [Verrucomicrobiae bacterium]|nr:DUF971 domain-containing protein [Verrucomicrobiae bacterium]
MQPADIQQIGNELAIKWSDQTESFVPLEKLRRSCPCAGCKGEVDIMGQLHKGPNRVLTPPAFELASMQVVGGYGIQPRWKDGHNSGIFSFDLLKRLSAP